MSTKGLSSWRAFLRARWAAALTAVATVLTAASADASIAYGSINNFDTVNDTGSECHGFEIELEDIHSTDITYTYNWNHYGVPKITEDNSVAGHPKVFIRWASAKKPDGTWAAYTAIPAGPIAPTDGHRFTDPSVNFGGEHFGAGYRVQPSAIKYNWLLDSGAGELVKGPPVQVATPTFVYFPPADNAPPQVQAAIRPPPPQEVEPKEFGDALWVKEIRTTTHNAEKVELRDLVSDDPDDPADKNWRNGEPDEVEVEWQILQTDFNKGDGGNNGELVAAPEDLDNGDEVVTRRYEFYKYVGPLDPESGEAKADKVGPDGIHGEGLKEIDGVMTDLSTVVIVGDYTGAQMAAVDVSAVVGLIDHLQDGEIDTEYTARTVVIGGTSPFVVTTSGALPEGMAFDPVTGVLSGTPIESGTFTFTVNASDEVTPVKTKIYTFNVIGAAPLPPQALVDTATFPAGSGTTLGDGSYEAGSQVTVVATAKPGFAFLNWTDHGDVVSNSATYTFTLDVNHSLIANFVQVAPHAIATSADPAIGGTTSGGGNFNPGDSVTVTATANPGFAFVHWTEGAVEVSATASYSFSAGASRALVAHFAALRQITTSAAPIAGGTTTGDGAFATGTNVTVTATANAGYAFVNWTEGGSPVSASAAYSFTAGAQRALVANFSIIPVDVPANVSPIAGATGQSLAPLLQAGEFSAAPGMIHAASQWIVARSADGVVVFDSGADSAHLTSLTVPPVLAYSTTYAWKVQYQGSNGTWSGYSAATVFTTRSTPPIAFTTYKGSYTGLVESVEPALRGAVTLSLSGSGSVSSSMNINRATYRVKGTMAADGKFTATVPRAGLPPLLVQLSLDPEADQITGSVSDGVAGATVLLNRVIYSKTAPAPESLVGNYTILLPPDPAHPGAASPQGFGYGTLTVRPTGGVSFRGQFGDATRLGRSTQLSKYGSVPFFAAPYRDGGSAIGWLVFRDTPAISDVDGALAWHKAVVPAPTSTTRYTAGFSQETRAVGARYIEPATGVRAISVPDTSPNATVAFSSGNLVAPMPVEAITVGLNNIVTPAPGAKLTMKLAVKTGLFTGRFTPPGALRSLSFSGALFQRQDAAGYGAAAGLFISQLQTGSVVLTPMP